MSDLTWTLLRVRGGAKSPDGTFGYLINGTTVFCTMEDDWKNNTPSESCIPDGTYTLQRSWYHAGGYEVFEVTNVPNRQRILIHVANTEENVKGCIAPGLAFGRVPVAKDEDTGAVGVTKDAVVSSKPALAAFMKAMEGHNTGTLTILWAPGVL